MIRSEALLASLASQQHRPYIHIPSKLHASLGDAARIFDLGAGDGVSLAVPRHIHYVSVLAGAVEAGPGTNDHMTVCSGETQAIATPAGRLDLTTKEAALVCVVDSEAIDEIISFDAMVTDTTAADRISMEAIERARRSPAFRRLPLECVETALHRMGHRAAVAGTEVIRQGEPGEIFYVLSTGRAEVWQTGLYDDEPRLVAELGPGDVFGEEALVTGSTRSATIRIVADAELLTLGKADYQMLISQQLVEEVEPVVAQTMLSAGYGLLDVRYAEEHEDACIPATKLIPLAELRTRIDELDRAARWIVYCRSGKRSAVALRYRAGHRRVIARHGTRSPVITSAAAARPWSIRSGIAEHRGNSRRAACSSTTSGRPGRHRPAPAAHRPAAPADRPRRAAAGSTPAANTRRPVARRRRVSAPSRPAASPFRRAARGRRSSGHRRDHDVRGG